MSLFGAIRASRAAEAVEETLDEHVLNCSLCARRFSDPYTTPCGHTFCRACILSYLEARIAYGQPMCPKCQLPILSGAMRRNVELNYLLTKDPAGPAARQAMPIEPRRSSRIDEETAAATQPRFPGIWMPTRSADARPSGFTRELQENACAPASNAIVTFPPAAACVGGFTQCPRVVGDHVCSSLCQHLVLDETGFWTCSLSGMVVSQQLSNGSYDQNRFMDDVVIPTPRPRSKRSWNAEDFYPNMIAACSQALNQLLNADKRELVDKTKLEKARKAAFRLAASQFEQILAPQPAGKEGLTVMRLLNNTYAEFEKLGGGPPSHVVTQTKIHSIASIAAQIYGTVIGFTNLAPTQLINTNGVSLFYGGNWTPALQAGTTIDATGTAIAFDGSSSSYLSLPPWTFGAKPLTIALWMRTDVASNYAHRSIGACCELYHHQLPAAFDCHD